MIKTMTNDTHYNEEIAENVSVMKACKLATQAKNNNETSRANKILSIISNTIKEDGKRGCYTGFIKIDGLE